MKYALIFSLLIGLNAHADNGLISVPEGSREEEPRSGDPMFNQDEVPSSKNIEDYVNWAKKLLESGRKNQMAKMAYDAGVKAGVRCLWFAGAYGFRQSSTNQYELNCFAGTARKISHIAFYKINFEYLPSNDCASDAKIREYFTPEGLRNRNGAMSFIHMIQNTCRLSTAHADPAKPVTRSLVMDAEAVARELDKPEREALRVFVNNSKDRKRDRLDEGGSGNPLRNANGAPNRDAK